MSLETKTKIILLLGLLLLISGLILYERFGSDSPSAEKTGGHAARSLTVAPDNAFSGSESCARCHESEFDDWTDSHHQLAMQPATPDTVLADFDGTSFTHFGVTTTFRREADKFFVTTQGADRQHHDYQVAYTFGVYPLQQYLIPFEGGRMQALQVCWDSRPKAEGGQRWFHLYPSDPVPPGDILHWTGPNFSWNYMCADCHSTGLRKNYDVENDRYHTTWTGLNVGCETCHGPGAEHVAWAESLGRKPFDKTYTAAEMKLSTVLKESDPGGWTIDPETLKPVRTHPPEHEGQLGACARCHSHRQLVQGDFIHGQAEVLDAHKPSVLEPRLYHYDGQIKEEVYVYGSFLQSKMHHAGVRCTDCHNPHSNQLVLQGNALCIRCHSVGDYDSPKHHFHEPNSAGAQCVNCHMPEKYYMVVDGRRDHSFRIPRPDLTEKIGTPNACNQCHADEPASWASNWCEKWYGVKTNRPPHYGEIFARADSLSPADPAAVAGELGGLIREHDSGIVRATAAWFLQRYAGIPVADNALDEALQDPDAMVREAAIVGLRSRVTAERQKALAPLLDDPVRAVRVEAARVLADVPEKELDKKQRKQLAAALEEYQAQLKAVDDQPGGQMGVALLHYAKGDFEAAEKVYQMTAARHPQDVASQINLAEMYWEQQRMDDGLKVIGNLLRNNVNNGFAQEAAGRWLIRQKKYETGVVALARATRLLPERADLHYFLGVGYNQIRDYPKAKKSLQEACRLAPNNAEYWNGLATIARDNGDQQTFQAALGMLQNLGVTTPGLR